MNEKWIVVTTINAPTTAIKVLSRLVECGWRVVVVGDKKTPKNWSATGVDYLSVDNQLEMYGRLSELIPYNHYCRKNIGYLYAIQRGAKKILETDDDNIPYESFGININKSVRAFTVGVDKFINIYHYFTDKNIWPRGLPLDEIYTVGKKTDDYELKEYSIHQFLADDDPDVDAIYRLIFKDPVVFDRDINVGVHSGSWVPFNSQNTLFFEDAFPLLYLPCFVSFRMTDIWRSFIAQRSLWIKNKQIVFRSATVRQERNQHDLMRDFSDEIPGYLGNKKIAEILDNAAENIPMSSPIGDIAKNLWGALYANNFINDKEMEIIEIWMERIGVLDCQDKSKEYFI